MNNKAEARRAEALLFGARHQNFQVMMWYEVFNRFKIQCLCLISLDIRQQKDNLRRFYKAKSAKESTNTDKHQLKGPP